MKKFAFLKDVTLADVAYEAYGKDLSMLFENSALALFEVMVDVDTVKPAQDYKVELGEKNIKELLFSFLSELVFIKDKDNVLFCKFSPEVSKSSDTMAVSAVCKGETINSTYQKLRTDVKAVTRHQFFVKKEKSHWVARVVLDI